MPRPPKRAPSAVAIAGLDPSGGAGLAADLRAFAEASVWGGAVCAALTVQSTRGVREVRAVAAPLVIAQAEALLEDLDVRALKTGALGSEANARAVAGLAAGAARGLPLVVDPVGAPTRALGDTARLDGGARVRALLDLARAATLVTPNLREAAALLGVHGVTASEARDAAAALVAGGCAAALVKGGHGGGAESVDWLATRGDVVRIAMARRRGPDVHGTGCALASLIAGRLAARPRRGAVAEAELVEAVRWARARLDAALARPIRVGHGLSVLDVRA